MQSRRRPRYLRSIFVAALVLAVLVVGFSLFFMPHLRRQALSDLMHYKTEQSVSRFAAFMEPVVNDLLVLRRWGEQGILDPTDPSLLDRVLIPLLEIRLPQVNGFMLADNLGNVYHLLKEDGTWVNTPRLASDDPRTSPWFQGAADVIHNEEVFWTQVYSFPSSEEPGVAASISFHPPETEDRIIVAALKITLSEMENMLAGLPLGADGRLLLIEEDFVRDFTRFRPEEQDRADRPDLTSMSLLKEPEVASGLSTWQDSGSPFGSPLFFRSRGRAWWIEVGFIKLPDEVKLAVLLPDRLLQSETSRLGFVLLYGALAGLAIVLLFVLVLFRRYGREADAAPARTKYSEAGEEEIRALIDQGESAELEFKSTLRWNLKTGKPDKRIELASLKSIVAFLNSEGGTLLIGVDDARRILGIDTQNFGNEDRYLLHFNNLIKQHIGLEFSQHMDFTLKPVGEKKILVVDCDPSEQPVFLKHDSEEEFYVRVGPGSRRLPTSKVLEYLKTRETG